VPGCEPRQLGLGDEEVVGVDGKVRQAVRVEPNFAVEPLELVFDGCVEELLLAPHPLLVGQTGPGFTITLKQNGRLVKALKAGVYTIRILDKSSIHNFHLTGPGLNKTTSVAKVYTVTWTVTLKKGTYTYVCDPHREIMRGGFKVT
jgi:Copper binding proteins, plastocyanin/azurin family